MYGNKNMFFWKILDVSLHFTSSELESSGRCWTRGLQDQSWQHWSSQCARRTPWSCSRLHHKHQLDSYTWTWGQSQWCRYWKTCLAKVPWKLPASLWTIMLGCPFSSSSSLSISTFTIISWGVSPPFSSSNFTLGNTFYTERVMKLTLKWGPPWKDFSLFLLSLILLVFFTILAEYLKMREFLMVAPWPVSFKFLPGVSIICENYFFCKDELRI